MLQRASLCSSLARAALAPCSAPLPSPWKEPKALECLLQQIPWPGDDLSISANVWSRPLTGPLAQGCWSCLLSPPCQPGLQGTRPWGRGDWQLLEGTKGRKTQLEFSHPPLRVWCLGSELFLPLLCLQQEGRMDLTAGESLPVLPTFSFLFISRTATGPSPEAAGAKSCVALVGTSPATWRAQHVQPGSEEQFVVLILGGSCRHCENSSAFFLTPWQSGERQSQQQNSRG